MILADLPNGPLLLVHIPHTGGNWRAAVLDQLKVPYEYVQPFEHKHYLFSHFMLQHDRPAGLSIATFVRQPHDYYETCWRRLNLRSNREWLKRANRGKYKTTWHPFREVFNLWEPSFEAFVYRVTSRLPGWLSTLYDLYCGPQYGETCDFIGRYETMYDDFWLMLDYLGEYVSVSERNRLQNMKVNETKDLAMVPDACPNVEWTEDMKARIQRSEWRAIDRFYRQREHRTKREYAMSFDKV